MSRVTIALLLLVVSVSAACTGRSDKTSPVEETVVFSGSVILDPAWGKSHVEVSRVIKYSTGPGDMDERRTNIIRLRTDQNLESFTWPTRAEFAADAVLIRDLDNDGVNELILQEGMYQLRVVWLRAGKLMYRPQDELRSVRFDTSPRQVESSGVPLFVTGTPYPANEIKQIPLVRTYRWSQNAGFVDVSNRFKDYIESVLLPRLEKELLEEGDATRLQLFREVYHR